LIEQKDAYFMTSRSWNIHNALSRSALRTKSSESRLRLITLRWWWTKRAVESLGSGSLYWEINALY